MPSSRALVETTVLTLPSWIARDPFHTLFLYYACNRAIPNVEAIIDWKSDVEVLPERAAQYLDQLRTYRDVTGAERALLVFMTPSQVVHA